MADLEFTSKDIDALAGKLDDVGANLDDREKAMMLAVFQMAGDQLAEAATEVEGFAATSYSPAFKVASMQAMPSLSDGFRTSFVRGGPGGLRGPVAAEWDVTVGVMGGM